MKYGIIFFKDFIPKKKRQAREKTVPNMQKKHFSRYIQPLPNDTIQIYNKKYFLIEISPCSIN